MHCVHTHVQTLVHHTSELMVHTWACTRVCTMEIENELGGRGEEEQSVQWSVHTRVQPSCITQACSWCTHGLARGCAPWKLHRN